MRGRTAEILFNTPLRGTPRTLGGSVERAPSASAGLRGLPELCYVVRLDRFQLLVRNSFALLTSFRSVSAFMHDASSCR
jgi:hypothetical protein